MLIADIDSYKITKKTKETKLNKIKVYLKVQNWSDRDRYR